VEHYQPWHPHVKRKNRKIQARYDLPTATRFGGATQLLDFLFQTPVHSIISRTPALHKRKEAIYSSSDIALVLLLRWGLIIWRLRPRTTNWKKDAWVLSGHEVPRIF